jgi:hypothetical protein
MNGNYGGGGGGDTINNAGNGGGNGGQGLIVITYVPIQPESIMLAV